MRHKKLLVPVGAAVAALLAYVSYAGKVSAEAQQDTPEQENRAESGKTSIDPVLQRLTYQIREQVHDLTLHKSLSGTM